MRIVIDQDIDVTTGAVIAEQVIHTETDLVIAHPLDSTKQLTFHELLSAMNQDSKLRDMTGWNIASQLEGDDLPKTRWQRLVDHTNSEHGDSKLKALGLTLNPVVATEEEKEQ